MLSLLISLLPLLMPYACFPSLAATAPVSLFFSSFFCFFSFLFVYFLLFFCLVMLFCFVFCFFYDAHAHSRHGRRQRSAPFFFFFVVSFPRLLQQFQFLLYVNTPGSMRGGGRGGGVTSRVSDDHNRPDVRPTPSSAIFPSHQLSLTSVDLAERNAL